MGARYYDPEMGLFLQPDWLDPNEPGVGTNRYAYSFNDPVNLSDPTGNAVDLWLEAISLSAGYASFNQNIRDGNYAGAAVDAATVATDTVLAAVPGIPGGTSLAVAAIRQGGKTVGSAGRRADRATNNGRFSGNQARNADEAQFLRNAEATFGESTTWTSVTRHRGELVVQRSDIELSPQNVTRMQNGQAPFVRNANGDWEPLQLHHVGRETGQMIEVTRSQNRYNPTTGGPLHIPGPGSPIRQPNYSQTYWQERYQGFVASGQIVE